MNKLQTFNYGELEQDTKEYLKQKESNIKEVMTKAYTDIGRELEEAQQKLSNNRNGIFEEWYKSLGYSKSQVNRVINRYKFIVSNWDNKELIETLPISLSYEISKPTADKELNQKVLQGKVSTLKEFNELKEDEPSQELENMTAEIKLYMNQLNGYKEYITHRINQFKNNPNPSDQIIELFQSEELTNGFSFFEELREPTNEEFLDYVVSQLEGDLKEKTDIFKL